jgi:hypothetical protein
VVAPNASSTHTQSYKALRSIKKYAVGTNHQMLMAPPELIQSLTSETLERPILTFKIVFENKNQVLTYPLQIPFDQTLASSLENPFLQ